MYTFIVIVSQNRGVGVFISRLFDTRRDTVLSRLDVISMQIP